MDRQQAPRSGHPVPHRPGADLDRLGPAGAGRVHGDRSADAGQAGPVAAADPGPESAGRRRPGHVRDQDGQELHRVSAAGTGAGRAAGRGRGGAFGVHQRADQGAAEHHAAAAADADDHPGGHPEPCGRRQRLRGGDSARRRHVLRGGPASAGGHRRGLRGRLGRAQRQFHSDHARSAAARLDRAGGADLAGRPCRAGAL